MKIVPLFQDQVASSDQEAILVTHSDFFEEYFEVFGRKARFLDSIDEQIAALDSEDLSLKVGRLEKGIKHAARALESTLEPCPMPRCVVFIGEGSYDGMGLIMKDLPHFFVDLSLVQARLSESSSFQLEIFLIHEALHGIHFSTSSEFYPRYYDTETDKYHRRMMTEGICAYLSARILGKTMESALWLGLVDDGVIHHWMGHCKEKKGPFGHAMQAAIRGEADDVYLWYDLFGVRDMDNLAESRAGYYYGYQIAVKLADAYGDERLLHLSYEEMKPHIDRYFAS